MNSGDCSDRDRADFMEFCCAIRKHRKEPRKGITIEQRVGVPLPLSHFRIQGVRHSRRRAHPVTGDPRRARRPLLLVYLKEVESDNNEREVNISVAGTSTLGPLAAEIIEYCTECTA